MRQVDESANGTEIALRTGEVVELWLPDSPTTGFKWLLKASGEPVCEVIAENFKTQAAAPGSGGTRHWQIKVTAPGTARIELIRARPWEAEAPPARTFTITIRAGD